MKISNLILTLRTGDIILFYKPFKWYKIRTYLSWIIRKIAMTKYNHAGVVVNNWYIPFLNEAQGVGLITESCHTRLVGCHIKIMRRLDIDSISEASLAVKANGIIGNTKYDFMGLVHQLVLNTWYKISGKKIWIGKKGDDASRRMYCYEYAAWVHNDLYPEWWKIDLPAMRYDSRFKVIFKGKIINK